MLIGRYDVMHRDHPRDEARYHDVTIPEQCMQMMVSCAECEGDFWITKIYIIWGEGMAETAGRNSTASETKKKQALSSSAFAAAPRGHSEDQVQDTLRICV